MNHLSSYLSIVNATHRRQKIQEAKFPAIGQVSSYGNVKQTLRKSLQKPDFGRDDLEFLISKLDADAQRKEGQSKNNALLQSRAVRAFQETFNPRRFSRYEFGPATKLTLSISKVKVNISLDATISQVSGDILNSGGIFLRYSFAQGRGDERAEQRAIASLIYWGLETGQIEPLPRLCMAIDVAMQKVTKAPIGFERFRRTASHACAEAASQWPTIEPPHDYDGPDWR